MAIDADKEGFHWIYHWSPFVVFYATNDTR